MTFKYELNSNKLCKSCKKNP